MMKVALLLSVVTFCLLALVAADDTQYISSPTQYISSPQYISNPAQYIASPDQYINSAGGATIIGDAKDESDTSWIRSFFSWLSGFFYTPPPGELITSRPIPQTRYHSAPQAVYPPSNAHLPTYPVQYVVPNEIQQPNYAYANQLVSDPSNPHQHINFVEEGHKAASAHQNPGVAYQQVVPGPPGAALQYPLYYPTVHTNPGAPHLVAHKPPGHQTSLHKQKRPGRPPFTQQKKRRPWPLLTNAGKSPQQIQREAKELEQLIEEQRDRDHSRLSLASLPH